LQRVDGQARFAHWRAIFWMAARISLSAVLPSHCRHRTPLDDSPRPDRWAKQPVMAHCPFRFWHQSTAGQGSWTGQRRL